MRHYTATDGTEMVEFRPALPMTLEEYKRVVNGIKCKLECQRRQSIADWKAGKVALPVSITEEQKSAYIAQRMADNKKRVTKADVNYEIRLGLMGAFHSLFTAEDEEYCARSTPKKFEDDDDDDE